MLLSSEELNALKYFNLIYFRLNYWYLIPLYRRVNEKGRNLKIRIKRPLTSMHFFFGLSGITRNPGFK
jgi:hypothetical protein